MRIGTHNGVFHADEVFACAAIALLHKNTEYSFSRSRDPKILAECDVVVDVGGEYDESRWRFDHHQRGGAGERPNGVKYSSFGLVWRWLGHDLCGSASVRDIVDTNLVSVVDATDNGQKLFEGGVSIFEGVQAYSLSKAISSLNPTWDEPADAGTRMKAFIKAVGFAQAILEREIAAARGEFRAIELTREAIARGGDPRVIEMAMFHPWVDTAIVEAPEALYGVYPSESGTWMVQAVPPSLGSFAQRRPLPEPWAGLRDTDFRELTGVKDGVFCHPGRFICGAETREGALALAQLALRD